MDRTRVRRALAATEALGLVLIRGWARTRRESKGLVFLEINDGSCLGNLQVLVAEDSAAWGGLGEVSTGAALEVVGRHQASPAKGQAWELHAEGLRVLGVADPESYPLQKKRHGDEFLRTIAHLRPRTNKYGAMFRIRSRAALAVHEFFGQRGFCWVHTPIITGSDCEGAGEMFRVTTLPPGEVDLAADFFGRQAGLTVSGQLEAEPFALALGDVYTFGPTFRAENSNTPRHAAEFWMIEPEMAFADLADDMALAEDFTKDLTRRVLADCGEDLALFERFVQPGLLAGLAAMVEGPFERVSYGQAIDILAKAGRQWEYAPQWGADLQTEHERFLCEEYFRRPVIVFDYPKQIKPFYMRQNDDGRTVAAMDLLVPRVGELIGGSQREERLGVLEARMGELGLSAEDYWWYLDTRRFGSAPHAGFGMGFERFLLMITGAGNIRDVIAYPRTPRHLGF
ncbi:asparagine--tRNA ligase [Desulfarculus baarsii]